MKLRAPLAALLFFVGLGTALGPVSNRAATAAAWALAALAIGAAPGVVAGVGAAIGGVAAVISPLENSEGVVRSLSLSSLSLVTVAAVVPMAQRLRWSARPWRSLGQRRPSEPAGRRVRRSLELAGRAGKGVAVQMHGLLSALRRLLNTVAHGVWLRRRAAGNGLLMLLVPVAAVTADNALLLVAWLVAAGGGFLMKLAPQLFGVAAASMAVAAAAELFSFPALTTAAGTAAVFTALAGALGCLCRPGPPTPPEV